MQPTLNPSLLNGHSHANGNGHVSLLPEGGGAAAKAAAEGAPSPTASTPPSPFPSSTASLRHSVPASLPHEDLLLDYLRRDLSLIDIARAHNLSLHELIAWSQLPSTRASLQALQGAAAERDATHAALARRRAIDALSTILEAFAYEETHEGARETPLGAITKWRRRETARRAATTLLRLTGSPASPRATEPAPPAPASEPPPRSPKTELAPATAATLEATPSSTDSTPVDFLDDIRRVNCTGFGAAEEAGLDCLHTAGFKGSAERPVLLPESDSAEITTYPPTGGTHHASPSTPDLASPSRPP